MPDQPNLLFIFTDEQAAGTLGCYGNERIATPNIDALAAESVLFDRAYISQPVCTPSRATIMTGLYPHTTGCVANNVPLPAETPCLPELGDFADYATGYHGKWHLGDEVFAQHGFDDWVSVEDMYRPHYSQGRDRSRHSDYHEWLVSKGLAPPHKRKDGFEHFGRGHCCRLPEELSKPAFLAEQSGRFIRDNAARPWMLYVNFLEPHMPFYSCRDGQYDPAEVALPPNFDHELGEDVPLKLRLFARQYFEDGHSGLELKTEADWRRMIANYWGLVSLVDTHVGRILAALRDSGQWDNTIIVYTSDHGDMMGAHRLLAKCTMFQEVLRIPMLLRIPGVATGGRLAEPVSQVDIVPTLLDAMGRTPPDHLEGYSWMPRLRGEGELAAKDVFVEWNGRNTGLGADGPGVYIYDSWRELADERAIRAAVTDPVRTILTPAGWRYSRSTIGEDELYDLNADPRETTNLAGRPEQAERIADLRRRIERWQSRTNDGNTQRKDR